MLTQMVQSFWERWKSEYITTLQERRSWMKPSRSYQVGDLVLVRNEQTPPGKWPLGLIDKVHPGQDGLVRVVTVKTANSLYKRPIAKLVLLQN